MNLLLGSYILPGTLFSNTQIFVTVWEFQYVVFLIKYKENN